MMTANSIRPHWFVIWRIFIYLAIALFILTILYGVPAYLVTVGANSASNISVQMNMLFATPFVLGAALALIALLAFVVINGLLSRQHRSSAIRWRQIRLPLVLALVTVILSLVVLFIVPPPNVPFPDVVTGLSVCTYRYQVIAFVDSDDNGIRDSNEAGIPGVNIAVTYPNPTQSGGESVQSVSTDSHGLTSVTWTYAECPSQATVSGKATINVQIPSVYAATTQIVFGPFSINTASVGLQANGQQTVYVGFVKTP